MKRFLLCILCLICFFAIVSCGEPTASSITKEEASTALKSVSAAIENEQTTKQLKNSEARPVSNDLSIGDSLKKKLVLYVVNAIDNVLETADISITEEPTVIGYNLDVTLPGDFDLLKTYFGTKGRIMFSYKDSVLKSAMTYQNNNGSDVSACCVEINYNFDTKTLNSFDAEFLLIGVPVLGDMLATVGYTSTGGKLSCSLVSGTDQAITDFKTGVITPISNSTVSKTITWQNVLDSLSAKCQSITTQAVSIMQYSGSTSATFEMTVGGTTNVYKYNGNGVLSVGDVTNASYYIEAEQSGITYYYKQGETWYKTTEVPSGLKLPGADYSVDKIVNTAALNIPSSGTLGFQFDTKEFKLTAELDSTNYSVTIKYGYDSNSKVVISEISILNGVSSYATLKFSNIGTTVIDGFDTVKSNATQEVK